MEMDIRWRQRFENYGKALAQLEEFLAQPQLNKFEAQGLIQCFEYTFELGWKVLKDYLEAQGLSAPTPRAAIQQAFQIGLISNGHAWIDALEKRNLMAHTYDEQRADEAVRLIRTEYSQFLQSLKRHFDSL